VEIQPTSFLNEIPAVTTENGEKKSTFRKEKIILGNPQPNLEQDGKVDHMLSFAHKKFSQPSPFSSASSDIYSTFPSENSYFQRDDSPYQRGDRNADLQSSESTLNANNGMPYMHTPSIYSSGEDLATKFDMLKSRLNGTQKGLSDLREVAGTGRTFRAPAPRYALRRIFQNSTSQVISKGEYDPFVRNVVGKAASSTSEQEESLKKFENLFLKNGAKYDGINIYTGTRK